jgi:hypothetical protein
MAKSKILLQLDTDSRPSVFDAVVAIDAGVEHLLQYAAVSPEHLRNLVYGTIFTRGIDDLQNTAIFIGGSDVAAGEALLREVQQTFIGPMRVSVMLDSNGANTTAAATVLAAARHVPLPESRALVLASTGPVGSRVVNLLATSGTIVRVASRSMERAEGLCRIVSARIPQARLEPVATESVAMSTVMAGVQVVISAGAPGVEVLSESARRSCASLRVAIDLSAVPPPGISGVEATDNARERDGCICYGALGVGGLKMKIHKAALRQLFTARNHVLDVEQISAIGREL